MEYQREKSYGLVLFVSEPSSTLIPSLLRRKWKLSCLCVDGFPACIKSAKKHRPDLIIINSATIEKDKIKGYRVVEGLDVYNKFQLEPEISYIPIIFSTSSLEYQDKLKALGLTNIILSYDISSLEYYVKKYFNNDEKEDS